jgi:hypothetical protein
MIIENIYRLPEMLIWHKNVFKSGSGCADRKRMIKMTQGITSTPIRHLMIFLRETPSDGIDGFERQLIHHATYSTEGSDDKSPLNDRISDQTKIKVLVTGEIKLNEKNIFIGLKMAFPEWDFQSYPFNMQKLFLKKPSGMDAKEVGVIATTDFKKGSGTNSWGLPCILEFSPVQNDQHTRAESKSGDLSWYERLSNRRSDEEADFSDEEFEREHFKEQTQESNDEIDFESILNDAKEMSGEELTQERSADSPKEFDFQQDLLRNKESIDLDHVAGLDNKEILEDFDEEEKSSLHTEFDEDEGFDFSFLEDAPSFSSALDEFDDDEGIVSSHKYDSPPFVDEKEDYLSSDFLEPEVDFELEGFVDETYIDEDTSLPASNHETERQGSSLGPLLAIISNLQSAISEKIAGLPLRKIALVSLITGLTTLALSYGVKLFEPDYETIRKADGVVDLYDWIILNDLVNAETETDQLIDLWKESNEYDQFWDWFDTQWTPKISRYEKFEVGLKTIGWVFLSPAIIILVIAFLGRAIPILQKQSKISDYEPTNRISLAFTTYTNDWSLVDAWAKETDFKILEVEDTRRLYRKKGSLLHPPVLCLIAILEGQVQLEAWVSTRIPTFLIPLLSDLGLEVLEAKKGTLPSSTKSDVNKLLLKLGNPPLA